MNIHQLRAAVKSEIVDYNQLKHYLGHYAHPRGKISEWIAKEELIRVKKGLYVFGESIRRQPYSQEVLANLIYGPSAVSLQYALSYYGLIPERVSIVTSITPRRNKKFTTPIGTFTYQYLPEKKYAMGLQLISNKSSSNFLIATPEKALCDTIYFSRKTLSFKNTMDISHYLNDDMRIDPDNLMHLDRLLLKRIVRCYDNRCLNEFFIHFDKDY